MSTPPEDNYLPHAASNFVARLNFADELDFSTPWEATSDTSGSTGTHAIAGNEYRQSLKLYADCITLNRRYVTAYQH